MDFIDVLKKLLIKDPNNRVTWGEIERMPWWDEYFYSSNEMNQKTIFLPLFLLAVLFCPLSATAQQVCLNVTNPTSNQRQEVVEADLHAIYQSLGLKTSDPLIVKNDDGTWSFDQ